MKKYSSIKAVRPIVFVAILVMLTILFALYSTSINPIAEDVFTALDLDDTPLADVATDVQQAEAGSMTVPSSDEEADGGYKWVYSDFSNLQEQETLPTLSFPTSSYSLSSSNQFAIARKTWNVSGSAGGKSPLYTTGKCGGTNNEKNQKIIISYDFNLSHAMYAAILSGKYTPTLSNVSIKIKESNRGNANITPWTYIGIGTKGSTDKTFNGYTQMWSAKPVKSTDVKNTWVSNGEATVTATGVSLTAPPASNGGTNQDNKVIRIAIGMHLYGEYKGLRQAILSIVSISCSLTISQPSDETGPTISGISSDHFTAKTFTASFADTGSALQKYELKKAGATTASSSKIWTDEHPTANDTSSVQNKQNISLSFGDYGQYTLSVWDIAGKRTDKILYYYIPKIYLKTKLGTSIVTSGETGGYVTIDAYTNGDWSTYSAEKTGNFPSTFTIWARINDNPSPGKAYYFKGFSHDGTLKEDLTNIAACSYQGAYLDAKGNKREKQGVFGYTFTINQAALNSYADGITIYAEFGEINLTDQVKDNDRFEYAGATDRSPERAPSIDASKHTLTYQQGTQQPTVNITITGKYKDGTDVASGTEYVYYAGTFDAKVTISYETIYLGSKTIRFYVDPINITIAPIFGDAYKTKITKIYDGVSDVIIDNNAVKKPNWKAVVGTNYDLIIVAIDNIKYRYYNANGDVQKDCSNSLYIKADIDINTITNYVTAQCSNAQALYSYNRSYDTWAYYQENTSTFYRDTDHPTGAIIPCETLITFTRVNGDKVYDGTQNVKSFVEVSITDLSGKAIESCIGVDFTATTISKDAGNNLPITITVNKLTTTDTTKPVTNYNVDSNNFKYFNATGDNVTDQYKEQFLINVSRAPMRVEYEITNVSKVYDNTKDFFGEVTYTYAPVNSAITNDTFDTGYEGAFSVVVAYDDVIVNNEAKITIKITLQYNDFKNYYWEHGDVLDPGTQGFTATFTAIGKIEKRNIALTIGNESKYYGTEDPNLYGLVSAVAANESAGLYAPVHKVTDIVAAVNRANGEDAYNDEDNQIQYPISLTLKEDAFISNYNIAVTNGTFTIKKTAVKFGFNITSQTVTYGYGNEAIIDLINDFDCITYTYIPSIGNNFKITDKETNVPKLGLEDNTDWSHYMAGTYSYVGSDRAITIKIVTHKNFIFELDTTKISDFTIEKKTLGLNVKSQSKEYTGASINPTMYAEDFELTQADIAVGDDDALQSAVKVIYVADEGPSACGTYDITAILTNDLLNNNYTLNVTNNQLNITLRMLTVEVLGFDENGTQKMDYSGTEPTLYYNIENYIEKHKDVVYANVEVSFTKINELGIVWPNAGDYLVSFQVKIVENPDDPDDILKNYDIEVADPISLSILKKDLFVTYDESDPVKYGEAPKGTLIYEGFVPGETEAVLTKQPTVKYHRLAVIDPNNEGSYMPYPERQETYEHINNYNGYINVGTWSFVASGGEAANYNFKYKPGDLTVEKATLYVEYNDLSLTYGDIYVEGLDNITNPYRITVDNAQDYFTITGYVEDGFVPSTLTDEYENLPDCYANVFGKEGVGLFIAYPYDKDGDNYQFGVHKITKDYFYFDFVNYEVEYTSGELTVLPADLKLSIKIPQGKELDNGEHAPIYYGEMFVAYGKIVVSVEGQDDCELSLIGDGFAYGESIAKNLINPETLGVRVSSKTSAEDVSATGDRRYLDAGDYEALVSKGLSDWSDYSSNYKIVAVTQDFKIAPKPLKITYEDKFEYKDEDEDKRGTKVYNGVPQSPADGQDYQSIWSYLLTVDEKDGFVKGVKVEGSGEYVVQPESFATYEAFKQISIATPVNETTLDPIGDVRVDENGNVIPYLVKPTLPNGVSINNYAITFVAGEFTITPKDLRITIYRQDRTYDATAQLPLSNKNVEFRFYNKDNVENKDDFANNADRNNITAILSLVLPDGVEDAINVGSYEIVAMLESDPTYARATNYNLVVNDDSDSYLYINPRTIKVSYKNVNAIYGEITSGYNHTQNLVYENIIAGEEPVGVGAVLNAPLANDRNYVNAGTYVITPDIANIELLSANYVFSAEQCVAGNLVIARKELNVTVQSIGVEAGCTSTGPNDPNDPCDEIHIEHLANLVTQAQQIAEQKAALEDLPLGMRVFNFIYTASDFVQGEDESVLEAMPFIANIQYLIDTYRTITETKEDVLDLVNKIDGVDILDANYYFNCTDTVIKFVRVKSKYNLTYLQSLKDAGSLIKSGSFVYNGNMRTMETSGLVIGDLEDLLAPEKIRENGDGGELSLSFVYTKTIDANGNAVIGSIPAVSISEVGTYAVTGYFQNEDVTYKNVTITLEATIVITARPVNYVIDGGLLEQIYGEADKHLYGKAEAVEGEEESGLILGQELGVSITIPTNDNVYRPLGNYAITALYTNTNYAVTFKIKDANGDLINLYDAVEDGVDENQYYVVNPRPIEISLGYQTQVYNGSVAPVIDSTNFQDVGAFRILPDESADIVISIAPEDQVALYEVGSYDLVAVALNGNYALTIASYNVIEITAASINVNATIDPHTYNGAVAKLVIIDPKVIGLKSGDALGTNVNVTYAVVGEAINVGDYEVTATIDNLNYVIGEVVTNGLTITKRSLTITLEPQDSDYEEGKIAKPDNSKYTYAEDDVAEGETLTVTIRIVDEIYGNDLPVSNAGDYRLTASYSVSNDIGDTTENYEVTVKESRYIINRIDPELDVKSLTDDSCGTYVYSPDGIIISTKDKYATSKSQGAITYSVFVDGQEPGEYHNGKDRDKVQVNAGAYKLSVKVAQSGNYTAAEQTVDIFIHKAIPTIDFSKALARVYTYDGTVQEIIGIEHNNTDGGDILEVTGNTFQDVPANGRLPVTATLKETANYHATSLTQNITINQATFDMSQYSFSGDVIRYGEKIIDGSAKGIPDGMEVAYKLNGVDVQDPENELKFKNAGTYVVEAIYNFNRNNYKLPNALVSSITIVINKVDISVAVVSKSGYYGDRPQYDVEDDVTIYGETAYDDELAVTIELEERDVYPVGTYQVTAKATANDNYRLTVISGTYTIVERNITIVADSKEVEYGLNVPLTYSIYYGHGAEKTQEVAGLIGEDKLNGRLDRVPGTTVGEYAITGEFTNSNYNIEIQDGVYKIIPKNITIVVYDQEGVSASDVNPGAYKVVGGMVRGDDLKIKVSGEVGSEPGTYVLTATYDVENKNYNVNIQEGSFILRLLAQINVNNASLQKLYDGTPYVLDAVATSGAPITYRLNGVDVENSFTEVGLYEVLLTAPVHGDYAAPTPLRITIEIRPQTLSTEVDGMHFIISTPEGFGALDEFRVVKTEDLVLSNDAYTSQINTAYVMYIVVDGVETPVEQYLDGKESKVKVKLTNELVEQGAGAWLTDQNVNALNTSNTLDEDGYIELNAIGGSHVLLVTERASAVPIIIILSVIGVVAVILFFMFLFRKKYIN